MVGSDAFLELTSGMGLRKMSAKTGEILWTSPLKVKALPALRHGYAPMLLNQDQSVVYVPTERYLYAVSTVDGSVLWNEPKKLKGGVAQMAYTADGIVVKGSGAVGGKGKPFIMVLDPKTGEPTWKKPFKDLANASSFIVREGKIVLYADKAIFSISIKDGSAGILARKIKFKDGEIPHTMELRENGYLLRASQNMALYDFSGKQVYHSYNKAPQASLLAKVASTAAIMAVNAASAAAAHDRAMATGRDQEYELISGNPVMSERFKQTAASDCYVYVLAVAGGGSHKKGAGIVQVDKVDGENKKSIVLGTKEPDYEMDEIGGRLFFMSGKKEITCYSF